MTHDASAVAARPLVSSDVPETLRVQPGSATTAELEARHPQLPRPVFWTKALEQGRKAAGAVALREGFAWNPQMDLLWALGYPNVILIADGLPEGESRQALIDHWRGRGRGSWLSRSKLANPLVIPHRGALAVLYEIEHPEEDAFDLDDETFLKVTEPGPLEPAKTAGLLKLLERQSDLPRASLVVEALVGSSAVLEVLCSIAEDPAFDERDSEFRGRAVDVAIPLLRRVPLEEATGLKQRLTALQTEKFGSFVLRALDPLSSAQAKIDAGRPSYALGPLEWVDGSEALVALAYDAQDSFPDIPSPRYVFVGGKALITREVANAGKYDSRDVAEAYLDHYTTIRSPLLLPVELEYLEEREYLSLERLSRPAVTAWLVAHAAQLRPWLTELARDPKHQQKAEEALALCS